MVKFEGKYVLEKRENYIEYLRSLGVELCDEGTTLLPEDRPVLIVKAEREQQYRLTTTSLINMQIIDPIPFQEKLPGVTEDTYLPHDIGKPEGNKITITSGKGGKKYETIYEFSDDNGIVETLQSSESKIIAKQYYKRM